MWLVFLVWGMVFYLALGFLFALAFVSLGVQQIDPAARQAKWGFRILIVPGSAIFWPYLLWRWARGNPPPEEYSRHRRSASGD